MVCAPNTVCRIELLLLEIALTEWQRIAKAISATSAQAEFSPVCAADDA
jgi:hypothetical protein